jgi:hypothetical protein
MLHRYTAVVQLKQCAVGLACVYQAGQAHTVAQTEQQRHWQPIAPHAAHSLQAAYTQASATDTSTVSNHATPPHCFHTDHAVYYCIKLQ